MNKQSKVPSFQDKVHLLQEAARLKTFGNKWVFGDDKVCSATNLARAGFYYIGTKADPDAVTCFMCDKVLEGWEETDDPWAEHRSHNNDCYFVSIGKMESDLTVEEFIDMWGALRLKSIREKRSFIKLKRSEIVKQFAALKKYVNQLP